VNLGIGLNKDHTVEENIHVKNLVTGVEFVSQIIEEAAAYNFQT
jgi:acetylornithine deacetylase/succinyl-diaminopimelate desuccinylase-like protein